jgi:hypothetical protein
MFPVVELSPVYLCFAAMSQWLQFLLENEGQNRRVAEKNSGIGKAFNGAPSPFVSCYKEAVAEPFL